MGFHNRANGGELGDDMMILVFDTTSGLHYYWSLSLCYF
jgi:hypothetical protein